MAIGSASQDEAGRTAHHARVPRTRALVSVGTLLGFAIAYFLAVSTIERTGYPLSHELASVASSTLLLIALLLVRTQRRWLYILAALMAHFAAEIPIYSPFQVLVHYLASFIPVLIAALPLWRLDRSPLRFDDLHTISILILFGGMLAPVVGALIMPAAPAAGIEDDALLTGTLTALLRAFTVLAVVPAVVNTVDQLRSRHDLVLTSRSVEAVLLFLALAATCAMFILSPFPSTHWEMWLCIPIPLLAWAAIRFGVTGASLATLFVGAVRLQSPPEGADPLWLVSFHVLLACAFLLLAVLLQERRHARRELETADARFRGIFDEHVMPMALWREGSPFLKVNQAFARLAGMNEQDRATLSGASRAALEQPPDPGVVENDPLMRFRNSTRALELADGRGVPAVLSHYHADAAREGVIYALDLSAFQNAESGRQRAESLHAAVLDSLHEEVAIVDAKGKVIEINRSWRAAVADAESSGTEPLVAGSNFLDACEREAARGNPDADHERRALEAVLEGSEIRCQLEYAGGRPGAAVWREVTIEKLRRTEGGAVITRADVTSRKRAELEARTQRQQLTHLGRVAILGQLSGAFAHELNQPLTSILGNAEAALRLLTTTTPAEELQEILHDIIDEDLRAAQVIQRLRALLDKGDSIREPVNLNTTVQEVLSLCKSELIARNVRVQTDLDPAIPAVVADRIQMQQIILNLLMNACDAMADRPVAERTVALATRVSAEPLSVELSIMDSGSGIPETDLERIFHPFVTSKPHGMGLGLAICRSVAESHRGRLWAGNVADGGAVFHLILPAGGALS